MPFGGLLVAGAIGIGAGIAGAASGAGKNNNQVQNFGQSGQYNPSASMLGGGNDFVPAQPGEPGAMQLPNLPGSGLPAGGWVKRNPNSANNQAANLQQQAAAADQRATPQANYANANAARNLVLGARNQQQDAYNLQRGGLQNNQNVVDLSRSAALGQQPSAAQGLLQQGANQSMADTMRLAAGARGPAALASAQYNALGVNAGTQQNTAQQMAILRAQEMATARDQYAGAANSYGAATNALGQTAAGIRGADTSLQGLDASMAQQQAGLGLQGLGLNDARNRYYAGLQYQALNDERNAAIQNQQLLAGSFGQQQGLMNSNAQNNANVNLGYFQGAVGGLSGAAQGAVLGAGSGGGGAGAGGMQNLNIPGAPPSGTQITGFPGGPRY